MAAHGNTIIENKLIVNERLELTDKSAVCFLGPNLTLRHCTVVLKLSARNLLINQASFVDCTFEVKQELKNHQQWLFASLKGCRFKGKLSGCDFGHWPEYGGEDTKHGAIEDCDFSEARLDGCRFMGCDERTLRFPRWPCFTFMDPLRHVSELSAAPWPERFSRVVIGPMKDNPPSMRAMTLFAPKEARDFNTTPEALRAVIDPLDCVVC